MLVLHESPFGGCSSSSDLPRPPPVIGAVIWPSSHAVPLPFLLFCFYPPKLPPYHPSFPSLQQSSFKHRDRLALRQALGLPSSCSFTGSIPEGSTSPLPPSRPRTACLCLPWCQWKLVELRPYPTNFLHQVQSLL